MGIFVGLLLGIGLFLCFVARPADRPAKDQKAQQLQALLREAQLPNVRPAQLIAASGGGALVAGAVVLTVSSTWSVAAVFAGFGAAAPWLLLRRRVLRSRRERRELWPYVI